MMCVIYIYTDSHHKHGLHSFRVYVVDVGNGIRVDGEDDGEKVAGRGLSDTSIDVYIRGRQV